MTRGAKSLLAFLRFRSAKIGYCYWRQEKIAAHFNCSVRSVGRWLRELIDDGSVTVRRRGHVNEYRPLKDGGKQKEIPLEPVRSDQPKCPIDGGAYKNIGSLNSNESSAQLVFSPEEIRHPEVQRVLRRAQDRINRADNPEAYAKRIVAETLARLRKPPQVETVVRPPVAMTPELAAFIEQHQAHQRRLGIA